MKGNLEMHRMGGASWLRASVMGADDGILSTGSLILGVAAADGGRGSLLIAGLAGLVAGAMSMAAGEYVSVSSQADTEQADLALERSELKLDEAGEQRELAAIYVGRGLDRALATEVADQLMVHNAVQAHARDELGMSEALRARPIQAAIASAGSFALGAVVPLLVTAVVPRTEVITFVSATSIICLAILGALASLTGGANVVRGTIRAIFWGVAVMTVTAGAGSLVGRIGREW